MKQPSKETLEKIVNEQNRQFEYIKGLFNKIDPNISFDKQMYKKYQNWAADNGRELNDVNSNFSDFINYSSKRLSFDEFVNRLRSEIKLSSVELINMFNEFNRYLETNNLSSYSKEADEYIKKL